jgi:hypothetical protein
MEYRKYTVGELLDDLDGHDYDTEVKIKLPSGESKEISGAYFINACIGGDNIFYLCEEDPIRREYAKRVSMFIDFCENILDICQQTYYKLDSEFDGDFDNCDILNIQNEIAKSCDDWFKWLKLDIKHEPGCGSEEELFFKIRVLKKWLERKEIPKEVPFY